MNKTDTEPHVEGPLSDALAQLDSLIQHTFRVELPPDLRWDALLLTLLSLSFCFLFVPAMVLEARMAMSAE